MKPYQQPRLMRFLVLVIVCGVILCLGGIVPLRLAIAARQAPHPEAILVLGGGSPREAVAAEMAQVYPDLEIWVSSGLMPKDALPIFQAAGIENNRVHLDYRATDTVTNFTTLVDDFKQRQIQHIFLVTSDFHMPRAKAIATIVLGSQGITFTPISVPSNRPQEPLSEVIRDSGRSLLWIFTGRTGSSLKERLGQASMNSYL